MKFKSQWLIPLSLSGVILLLVSLWLFAYPPFGLGIFTIIMILFVGSSVRYYQWLRDVESQQKWLNSYAEGEDLPANPPKEIQKRIRVIQEVLRRNEDPYKIDFADLLSTRESSRSAGFAGGTLIVLGLLGTFYGLINVVTVAGSATAAKSVDLATVLPEIFANLQGIFGSSLSGLSASLLLGVMHQIWQNSQAEYLADVEEFCRFTLLPKLVPAKTIFSEDPLIAEIRTLRMDLQNAIQKPIENSLQAVQDLQQQGFALLEQKVSSTLQNLSQQMVDFQKKQSSSWSENQQSTMTNLLSSMSEQWKSGSQQFENHLQALSQNLHNQLSSSMTELNSSQAELMTQSLAHQKTQNEELLAHFQSQRVELGEWLKGNLEHLSQTIVELKDGVVAELPKISALGQLQTEKMTAQVQDLLTGQAEAYQILQATQEAWMLQVAGVSEQFKELQSQGLDGLLQALKAAAEGSKEGLVQLSTGLDSFKAQLENSLQVQSSLADEWTKSLGELRIHQMDLQASMEFFRAGTEYMVEQFGSKQSEGDDLKDRQNQWEEALMAWSEKNAEILRENALKTREILMEILER